LPFSKGIMATSLFATGMPTDQAYGIAATIASRLRARG
jgi:2-phosphoglycerate kinase